MSTFSHIADVTGINASSGTSLACSSTLTVLDKDVLVCMCGWRGGDAVATCSDGGSNTFTMLTRITDASSYLRMGYILVAASATSTFTFTLDASRTGRDVIVMQFRPDGTKTISLENSGAGATGVTAQVTTASLAFGGTENDKVVVAAMNCLYGDTYTTRKIATVAATGFVNIRVGDANDCDMWYNLFTDGAHTGTGEILGSGANNWVADMLGIKAVSGGGGGPNQVQQALWWDR
jgi:hypothetical protein